MVKIRDEVPVLSGTTATEDDTIKSNGERVKTVGDQQQQQRQQVSIENHKLRDQASDGSRQERGETNDKRGKMTSTQGEGDDQSRRLPEPKLELVNEMRQLLSAEFKVNPERYSRPHYNEIMDENSPYVCWRYLLQRDESVRQALELAKETLAWRQENRCDTLRPDTMIKDFWLRAPIGFLGKSKSGNDVVYAIGKNFKKPDACVKQTIRDFITYLLLDWDRRHKNDLAQLELVFDVTDTGYRNIDLDFSRWLVSIRDFVPARVRAIYFVGIPFIMRPIIRLIISWLPARFKNIAHCGTYEQLVRANMDDDCIPEEIGGGADNKWRLAPLEAQWAHELDDPQANKIYKEICEACSFNTSQEYLDKVYRMQEEHEKSLKRQQ